MKREEGNKHAGKERRQETKWRVKMESRKERGKVWKIEWVEMKRGRNKERRNRKTKEGCDGIEEDETRIVLLKETRGMSWKRSV